MWFGVIPVLAHTVVPSLSEVSFQAGILISALVCFGPALFLLGMISPVAIKVAAPDLGHVGRSAGAIYAWATVGSILGALATGFLLLPLISVSRICYTTGLVLLALAAGRWLGRSRAPALTMILIMAVAGSISTALPAAHLSETGRFQIVSERPSYYGTVRVIEDREYRYLLVDGMCQNAQALTDQKSAMPYIEVLEIMTYLRPSAKEMLLIGLGGGDLVRSLHQHGIQTTAVEIDEAVAEAAFQYFGLQRNHLTLAVADGRDYLRRHQKMYDYLVLDAFSGGCPPSHLFSVEAFNEMKQRLRRGGLLGVNTIVENIDSPIARDLTATIQSVFSNLMVVATESDSFGLSNLIFFASDESIYVPPEPGHSDDILAEHLHPIPARVIDHTGLTGDVITDDYNRIDLYAASAERKLREQTRFALPPSVLAP